MYCMIVKSTFNFQPFTKYYITLIIKIYKDFVFFLKHKLNTIPPHPFPFDNYNNYLKSLFRWRQSDKSKKEIYEYHIF